MEIGRELIEELQEVLMQTQLEERNPVTENLLDLLQPVGVKKSRWRKSYEKLNRMRVTPFIEKFLPEKLKGVEFIYLPKNASLAEYAGVMGWRNFEKREAKYRKRLERRMVEIYE